jgi:hypothetical protein
VTLPIAAPPSAPVAAVPAATTTDSGPGRNTLIALIVGVFLLATLMGGGLLWFFTR